MSFYDALLCLYPASFRREYGDEMRGLFAMRAQQTSGMWETVALWIGAISDVLVNAARLHWDMTTQDLYYTARMLVRSPGFALTAIVVTALGVGANTAAFSVADFVLLRPLPFADPDRLVKVWERPPTGRNEVSPPNFHDWRTMSHSFAGIGAFHPITVNFTSHREPERLDGVAVTADLLPLLGVQPALGRLFTSAEERDGADATVVLSDGLWRRAFGGDSGVLGRTVRLDGAPHVIIGVMPGRFHFPNREVALWTPMPAKEQDNQERDNTWFEVVGRLKRGVTLAQAQADLGVVAVQLQRAYPKENERVGISVYGLHDEVSDQSRLLLLALCGAAACVLLIACANLASLLIARSLARRRELDVRTALGAGRERLVRQLVTESLVVAGLGGALGVTVAVMAVPLLSRLVPATLPIAQEPTIDVKVLLFALFLTAVTGIGFGVVPALRASARANLDALREGARTGGGQRARLRTALVIGEITASMVLLIASGLLLRALGRLEGTDPGFRPEGVITMRTVLPNPAYDSTAQRERFYAQILSRVRALPGVQSAAYISFLPMVMGGGIWPAALPGEPERRAEGHVASLRFTTPGFFATLRIPQLQGRDVAETDGTNQPLVAVVSESFARRFWPGQEALGKRFTIALTERTVVGVVGDIRVRGLDRTSEPQVYVPYKQQRDGVSEFYSPKDLVIRTTGLPESLVPTIRSIVHETDPEQPVSNVETMSDIVADQTTSRSVQIRILSSFAVIAVLLGAVGIHGLLAFTVSQRKHEICVRMALGARRGAIVEMVMRQGMLLALFGVVPGIALAYVAGRAMQGLLAGVQPSDAPTFVAATALCVTMTLAGSLMPVLRAVRVAPASAFRGE